MQRCSTFLGRSIPFVVRPTEDGWIVSRAQRGARPQAAAEGGQEEKKEWTPWGQEKARPAPPLPEERHPQPDHPPQEPEQAPPKAAPRPPRYHMYEDLNLQYQPKKHRAARYEQDLEAPQEPRPQPRRLGRSVYDAVQTHGHFGLVDGGETLAGDIRRIVLHVPKRSRGYTLDLRQGDWIYANSARGKPVRGRLDVAFVSRHKYTPPGHAVTSCVIGVPAHQWSRFVD